MDEALPQDIAGKCRVHFSRCCFCALLFDINTQQLLFCANCPLISTCLVFSEQMHICRDFCHLRPTVTEEEMYQVILKVAEKLLTPLKLNLLKFALSLRAHSPTVEMFNQVTLDVFSFWQSTKHGQGLDDCLVEFLFGRKMFVRKSNEDFSPTNLFQNNSTFPTQPIWSFCPLFCSRY